MNLKKLLSVLFKRRIQILALPLGAIITVAVAHSLSGAPQYKASAQILLESGREYVSDLRLPTGGEVKPTVTFNSEEQVAVARQILTSRSLLRQLVQTLGPTTIYADLTTEQQPQGLRDRLSQLWHEGLARLKTTIGLTQESKKDEPARSLEQIALDQVLKNLSVGRAGESSMIWIAFEHPDPVMAAKVVNNLVSLYLERHLEVRGDPRLTKLFQEQFTKVNTSLEQAEHAFRAYKDRHQLTLSPEEEIQMWFNREAALQSELDTLARKEAEIESRVKYLHGQLANTANDPGAVQAVRDRLVQLQLEESTLLTNYQEDTHFIQDIRARIRATQQELQKLLKGGSIGKFTSDGESLYSILEAEVVRNQGDLGALAAHRHELLGQMETYQAARRRLMRLAPEFNQLRQEMEAGHEAYRVYQAEAQELQLSEAMDSEKIASVKLIESAEPPLMPLASNFKITLLIAAFLGIVSGVGLAFLREQMVGTLDNIQDVEQHLALPVLASIPSYKS